MAAPSAHDGVTGRADTDATGPPSDAGPLRRVRTLAYLLDEVFRVPGTDVRFGLDPIVSLLPVVGSAAGTLVSLYIVLEAAIAGVSKTTLLRMLAVVAVDTVVGSVPVVGPLADAAWKANVWNVRTLEQHVAEVDGAATTVAVP